jgi:hypothetical protein
MGPEDFHVPKWLSSEFKNLKIYQIVLLRQKGIRRYRSWTYLDGVPGPCPAFGQYVFLGEGSLSWGDNDGNDLFSLLCATMDFFALCPEEGVVFCGYEKIDGELLLVGAEWKTLVSDFSIRELLVNMPEGGEKRRNQESKPFEITAPRRGVQPQQGSISSAQAEKLRILNRMKKKFGTTSKKALMCFLYGPSRSAVQSEAAVRVYGEDPLPARYYATREGFEVIAKENVLGEGIDFVTGVRTTQFRQRTWDVKSNRTTCEWLCLQMAGAEPFFPFYPDRIRVTDKFLEQFAILRGCSSGDGAARAKAVRKWRETEEKLANKHYGGKYLKEFMDKHVAYLHRGNPGNITLDVKCKTCQERDLTKRFSLNNLQKINLPKVQL